MLTLDKNNNYELTGATEEIRRYCTFDDLDVNPNSMKDSVMIQVYENLSTALEIFNNIDTNNVDKIGYELCKLTITNRLIELYQVTKKEFSDRGDSSKQNLAPLYLMLFARIKYLCDERGIESSIIDIMIEELKTTFNYNDCMKYLQSLTNTITTPSVISVSNKEPVKEKEEISEIVETAETDSEETVKPRYLYRKYERKDPYYVGDRGGLFSEYIREAMYGLGYNRYELADALGIPLATLAYIMDHPFKWYKPSKHRIALIYLHLGERMTVRSFVNDIIRIMHDDPNYGVSQRRFRNIDLAQAFLNEYPTDKIRDIMDAVHKIVQDGYRKANKKNLTENQKAFFKKFSVTLKDFTKEEKVPYQKPKILEVRKSYTGNCVSTATPVSTPTPIH